MSPLPAPPQDGPRKPAVSVLARAEALGDIERGPELATLPIDRVYFGLNDFAISRGGGPISRAVADGSVARARESFAAIPFGIGGLTAIDAGCPVQCRRLLEELARLDCSFSFRRRSFRRDTANRDVAATIAGIQSAWRDCLARDARARGRDRAALLEVLDGVV